ncbi:HNH endonuclease [Bacillus marasmi]|uniref:HNH endonuclease n=1 Tax=Bacillus marasmi TaxID=1926279 RepID=UPI001FEAD918|nr:HNH endonuclease [Bacillus marasmi]
MHRFTGKVGDIVDRTIDERLYTDMDGFVDTMHNLSPSNYTTKNRLGISETVHITAGAYNSVEIEKPEISLDDIFSGDNFYGKQMKLEYEAWKELNPNQDFSQKEYQQAIVNTRAFEYESIRDTQENKEFWFQIGALVVIIGATLICPPAGMALGVVYGAYELSSALYEDFQVLHRFTGKVGDIVDRTIDERFYKYIDAFVEEMRDLSISNYTTKNRLGISEKFHITAGAYNSVEIEKPEISLDDIFSGDNFYGKQMKLEYENWKELNSNQDFSQKEYQQAIVNTRAFEYESIRDTQENKEFWFQIGALVVIIGATLICPPAGMALGAVYGTYELSSAVSGKDLVSGRELGTSERWVRGLLAPLDIVPGVSGLTKFSSTIRLTGVSDNMEKLGLSSGVKGGIQPGATSRISNLVETASRFGTDRLRRAEAAFQNGANIVKNKVIKDTIEVAQVADKVATGAKNLNPLRIKLVEDTMGNKILAHDSAVNTHSIENGLRDYVSRIEGVKSSSGGNKGTHIDIYPSEIDEVINNDYDINGNLINRSIVPKGYESVEDFLKVVDDTTIKEYGYDSIEEFKEVVGHLDDYLNASPQHNIVNKGLAGGKHVKGVDYDLLGFPIFKGKNLLFTLKMDKKYYVMKDTIQFKECTRILKEAIEYGELASDLFTPQQLDQIEKGRARIKGFTWHHHQVPGKMQLVLEDIHGSVSHLGGNKLWGKGIR